MTNKLLLIFAFPFTKNAPFIDASVLTILLTLFTLIVSLKYEIPLTVIVLLNKLPPFTWNEFCPLLKKTTLP